MAVLIDKVSARQIIDSRANPTIEVEVVLSNGIKGVMSAPSGASTGSREAVELRDNNPKYLFSKSVIKAVDNVNKKISKALLGQSPFDQHYIDEIIKNLDSSSNFSNLGANAAIATSLAVAVAASKALGIELFQYIGGINANRLPIPMVNVINGGVHADNKLDFQEFMLVPFGASSFEEAIVISLEVFHSLKSILKNRNLSINIGDEGGFAPLLNSNLEALDLLVQAICKSNYSFDKVKIALDIASSEFYCDNKYCFDNKKLSCDEMIDYLSVLCEKYPIISLEDPLDENDFDGWKKITEKLDVMLVGDDLFTTNPCELKKGIKNKLANSILIKPNQIGTLSKTLECVSIAKNSCYNTIISHRSGETESTFIADLAVGLNAGFIKTGSMSRSERTAKYNRLLKIEKILGSNACYSFLK